MGIPTIMPAEEARIKDGRFEGLEAFQLMRFLAYYGIEARLTAQTDAERINLLKPVAQVLSKGYAFRPISKTWMEPGNPNSNLSLTEAYAKATAPNPAEQEAAPADTNEATAPLPQLGEPAAATRKQKPAAQAAQA